VCVCVGVWCVCVGVWMCGVCVSVWCVCVCGVFVGVWCMCVVCVWDCIRPKVHPVPVTVVVMNKILFV